MLCQRERSVLKSTKMQLLCLWVGWKTRAPPFASCRRLLWPKPLPTLPQAAGFRLPQEQSQGSEAPGPEGPGGPGEPGGEGYEGEWAPLMEPPPGEFEGKPNLLEEDVAVEALRLAGDAAPAAAPASAAAAVAPPATAAAAAASALPAAAAPAAPPAPASPPPPPPALTASHPLAAAAGEVYLLRQQLDNAGAGSGGGSGGAMRFEVEVDGRPQRCMAVFEVGWAGTGAPSCLDWLTALVPSCAPHLPCVRDGSHLLHF